MCQDKNYKKEKPQQEEEKIVEDCALALAEIFCSFLDEQISKKQNYDDGWE